MPDYRRRLPHFHPQDAYVFLTWRLWGTLPLRVDSAARPTAGHAFVAQDRAMDRCAVGPLWLQNPYIANLVAEAILIGQGERRFYEFCAWGGDAEPCSSAHPSPGSHCGTDALAEGIDLAERQPNPGADRAAVLAGRVFRSLPARFEADRANRRIYRGQPGFSRLGALGGMLAVVQRGLAGETACPTKPPRRSSQNVAAARALAGPENLELPRLESRATLRGCSTANQQLTGQKLEVHGEKLQSH